MTDHQRAKVPPFVTLAGRLFVVTNWNHEIEDVTYGDALILRQLGRQEEELVRRLLSDVEVEAFARTQGRIANRAKGTP